MGTHEDRCVFAQDGTAGIDDLEGCRVLSAPEGILLIGYESVAETAVELSSGRPAAACLDRNIPPDAQKHGLARVRTSAGFSCGGSVFGCDRPVGGP